jgi:hypothetical protein
MPNKRRHVRKKIQEALYIPGALCIGEVLCTAGIAQSLWMIGFLVICGVGLMLARLP